jgi:hypothetical protein
VLLNAGRDEFAVIGVVGLTRVTVGTEDAVDEPGEELVVFGLGTYVRSG